MANDNFCVRGSFINFIDIVFSHNQRTAFEELIISSVDNNDFWKMCIDDFLHCVIPYRISGYIQSLLIRMVENNAANLASYSKDLASSMLPLRYN
ncbi:hypothetical protein D3C73_798880 [compost metagenome]